MIFGGSDVYAINNLLLHRWSQESVALSVKFRTQAAIKGWIVFGHIYYYNSIGLMNPFLSKSATCACDRPPSVSHCRN